MSFTVPLQKSKQKEPLTKTQKLVTDFHKSEMAKRAEERGEDSANLQSEIELTNTLNLSYTGPVYFGTPLQTSASESEFIYDTGSGYLTTTTTECSNCSPQYYDMSASTSRVVTNSTTFELSYGSADLQGYMVNDLACLDTSESICADSFSFYAITS